MQRVQGARQRVHEGEEVLDTGLHAGRVHPGAGEHLRGGGLHRALAVRWRRPAQDAYLLEWIDKEFSKRVWIFNFQASQVVTAIIEHEGSNCLLRGKDHLHFGVRNTYKVTDDGMGVEILEDQDPLQVSALKYPAPEHDPTNLLSRLHAHEIQALYGAVPWVAEQPPAPKERGKKRKADDGDEGD